MLRRTDGRDGVATDRQLGVLFGVSRPTATRRRNRALDALFEAGREWRRQC
ncbi:transposase family protein [Amycolatopsis sp. SB7-3]|uniref:transposase family protein n=1 Tax=Amycolatopsis sp. SB7-3 TaxID=3373438 RepID=UPI003744704C